MATKYKQFNLLDVATVSGSRVSEFEGAKQYVATADIDVNQIVGGKAVTYDNRPSRADLVMGQDDVLFAKMKNTVKVLAGSPEVEDKIFSTGFYILTPKENVSKKYLYFYLLGSEFNKQKNLYSSGATMAAIGNEGLKRIKISIPLDSKGKPDIKEQERIVTLLEEAEELKRKRAEVDQKMTAVIPALFNKMFGDVSSWPQKKLGDGLAIFRYGTSVKCDYDSKKTAVLRIPNILRGNVNTEDLKYGKLSQQEKDRLVLKRGDVLFVRTNGNPDYVGRCASFDLFGEYAFASYLIRARVDTSQLNPDFLSTYLRTVTGRKNMAPAIRTTAGQSNINIEGLKNISVPVPPIKLQDAFAEKIKDVFVFEEKQKRSTASINNLFSSLLSRSFVNK